MKKITLLSGAIQISNVLLTISLHAMSVSDLKDTYSIFKEPYQHLSPLHGALLWESGIIKNYYDAALSAPASTHKWLPAIDAPVRLVRALFTDTMGNLDVSNNPNYPARHLGISTIGAIIARFEHSQTDSIDDEILEDLIIRNTEFAQSVRAITHERESTRAHYEALIKQCESQQQKEQIPGLKYSCTTALNKLDTQRLYRDWSRKQSIDQIKARIAELDTLSGKEKSRAQKERTQKVRLLESLESAQPGGDYNRVHELAQAIIDAYKPSMHHPQHCATWILLACMYRKAKNKSDIFPYISTLLEKIGPEVCHIIDDSWISRVYTPSDCDLIKQRIMPLIQTGLPNPIDNVLYEDIVYAQILERYYKGPFPKIAEYANIVIQGLSFPDCCEITFLNFCNLILYDRSSGTFDIKRVTDGRCCKMLIDFYNEPVCKQAANVGQQSIHQTWGSMLQNLPFITYRKQIITQPDGSKTILTAPKDTNGFIYGLPAHITSTLPHNGDRIFIAGRWYIHVEESHGYLCEMHPTVRNFIIILNQLFNLNLFAGNQLEKAFVQDGFNARYFPQLGKHFELLRSYQWTEHQRALLDSQEYTDQGIRLSFAHIDLILTDEHAEIITHVKGDTITDIGPQLVHQVSALPDSHHAQQRAQLLALFPPEARQLPPSMAYRYLLYLSLSCPRAKIDAIVFCIQKIIDPAVSQEDRTFLCLRAKSLIRQLPERLDWHYHEELIDKLNEHALQIAPMKEEIERLISTAKNRLAGVPADCEYVPSLYSALMAKGLQCDDVMIVIDNLIARAEPFDRRPLLNLLITMAKQGKAITQARKAVDICIHNSIQAERQLAQTLSEIIGK